MVFSVVLLREPLYKSDVVGVVLISTGSTMFLISAETKEVHLTPQELQELYLRPASIIFISASFICLFISVSLEKCIK
jgi:hypothetical protein